MSAINEKAKLIKLNYRQSKHITFRFLNGHHHLCLICTLLYYYNNIDLRVFIRDKPTHTPIHLYTSPPFCTHLHIPSPIYTQ